MIEPILFTAIISAIIIIFLFFIIKGLKTGIVFNKGGLKYNRKKEPILFWAVIIFQAALTSFLAIVLLFVIFRYLI